MKKIVLLGLAFVTTGLSLSAQTLFTYGSYTADAGDFLRAYKKNNTQPVKDKAKSMRDYLDLYIKSRLKIQEAYARRLDTLPYMQSELVNLRTQIQDNYMTDPEATARMTREAFQRSLKDIQVAHIFISFRGVNGFPDSLAAGKKKDELLSRLQKGEDFGRLAEQFSDDTTTRKQKGDLGFITVFTLPYEFETAIYTTPVGKYSSVIRSKAGYHVFKNLGERKAAGRIKIQQILLAFPPGADAAQQKELAARADSLYKRILAGDNFNKLAADFSNDYVSAASGGLMPEIAVGQYDPSFEKAIRALPKDGAVSKPFLTQHGWHIVKRVSLKPVVTNPNDKANQDELKQRIIADSRWKNARDFVYNQVRTRKGLRKFDYSDAALWNMTDSVLDHKPMTSGWEIKATTPLFAIGDSIYTANHWVNYAHMYRYKADGSGVKTWEQVREEWIPYAMVEYYKDHLEEFSEDFRQQMTEFKEGNLFFEIMQQEVWNKSQADTAALQALYEKNKKNYLWQQSADAVLFFCSDFGTANAVYEKIKANPANWRQVTAQYSDKVVTDSARFEWNQLPNLNKMLPRAGALTTPLLNTTDNTASFAYIIQSYPQPTQRSFTEARGLVISDYQAILEKDWDDLLRKKYPVQIDEKVLAAISK